MTRNELIEVACRENNIDELCRIMQDSVRRLISKWNHGFRPSGSRKPAKHVRQETREQELARFKRAHRQPSAKVKCGVKNTRTSDAPNLDEDETLSIAETYWYVNLVSTGDLAKMQGELGTVHGFNRSVVVSFNKARHKIEWEKKRAARHSTISDRVSRDIDGLPITAGGDWQEDERLCGRVGAGESLQEKEHSLYLAIEARACEQLAKAKDGKLLCAIASRLDWPVRKIAHWLRENGTRIRTATIIRLIGKVQEAMQESGRDDLDTDPDTDTDPCCERIGKVIPAAWKQLGSAASRKLEFNPVRSFPDSRFDRTQYADEVTIANRRTPGKKDSSPSWALSQAAIDGYNARHCAVDSLLTQNGMQDEIYRIESLVTMRQDRTYAKLPRTSSPDKPTIGASVGSGTIGTDFDYDKPGSTEVEAWDGLKRIYVR